VNNWILSERTKEHLVPLGLFIGVFLFLAFFTTAANIHDDGFQDVFLAQEMAKTGSLLETEPHRIINIIDSEIIYHPIPYPLTSQLMMSIFYLIGGRGFLHFFAPFCGALAALFIYLLLRRVNRYVGLPSGFGAVVLNSYVFINIFPRMEEFLLVAMMACLYFYYMFLKTKEGKYALLTALFLGLAMSTKQQGLVFAALILLHGILRFGYEKIGNKSTSWAKSFVIMITVASLLSIAPLYHQVERTGTLGSTEDKPFPPFLQQKIPIYQESFQLQEARLGYSFPVEESVIDVVEGYLFYPLFYDAYLYPTRSIPISLQILCMLLATILFIFACQYLFKRDPTLLPLLLLLFIGEIILAFVTKTPIKQYHVLGLAVYAMFFVTGIFAAANFIRSISYRKLLAPLFSAIVVMGLLASLIVQIYPAYGDSSRYTDNYLEAYEEMGKFVQDNTPEDAIFLASSVAFTQYSQRRTIWLDAGNSPPELYLLLTSDDINYILHWLEYFKVDYVFIEERQIGMGTGDGWPVGGLTKFLSDSPYFEEIHSIWVPGGDKNPKNKWAVEGKIILYKVIY
jgi:hypothetical protein